MQAQREAVEAHLDEILASRLFASAPRMQTLLRYLVVTTLDGKGDRLKAYSIGIDVFERDESFDPGSDSIVRVQMGRLRTLLESYYRGDGAKSVLRIYLPKGSYRAVFASAGESDPDEAGAEDGAAPLKTKRFSKWAGLSIALVLAVFVATQIFGFAVRNWLSPPDASFVTVAVVPIETVGADPAIDSLTHSLDIDLNQAVSKIRAFRLCSKLPASALSQNIGAKRAMVCGGEEPRFVIRGQLANAQGGLRFEIQIVNWSDETVEWSSTYSLPSNLSAQQVDERAALIAWELRLRLYGAAVRSLKAEARHTASPWLLYLQALPFSREQDFTERGELERLQLARQSVRLDPDFGPGHALVAERMAFLFSGNPALDTESNRQIAADHARRALDLASDDAETMFLVARYDRYVGRLADSEAAARRALEVDPDYLAAQLFVRFVPYACKTSPPNVLADLARRDAALPPDDPVRWASLTWLNTLALNNGQWARAVDYGRASYQIRVTPDTAMRYATSLVHAGNVAGAKQVLREQRLNWPHLDPAYYAATIPPRQCAESKQAGPLLAAYDAMARAVAE